MILKDIRLPINQNQCHFTALEDEIRQRRKSECQNDELRRKLKTAQETGKEELENVEEGKEKRSN